MLPSYGWPDQGGVRGQGTPATTVLPCCPKQHRPFPQDTSRTHPKAREQEGRRPISTFGYQENEPPEISHANMAKTPQRLRDRVPDSR